MKHKLFSEYTNTYETVRSQLKGSKDAFERQQRAIDRERYETFDLPSPRMIDSVSRAPQRRPANKKAHERVTEFPRERLDQKPKQQQKKPEKHSDAIAFPLERVQQPQNRQTLENRQSTDRKQLTLQKQQTDKRPSTDKKKTTDKRQPTDKKQPADKRPSTDKKQPTDKKRQAKMEQPPQKQPQKVILPSSKETISSISKHDTKQAQKKVLLVELPQQREMKRKTLLILLAVSNFVLIAAIGTLLAVRQYSVVGISMEPTLMEGDRLYYTSFQDVSHGDIVIFDAGDEYGLVVKRVIGLPGDTIQVSASGAAVRNMELLDEPYMQADIYNNSGMRGVTVQEGMLFLMGDNRADSIDSRDVRIGQIPISSICGKVRFVVRGVE